MVKSGMKTLTLPVKPRGNLPLQSLPVEGERTEVTSEQIAQRAYDLWLEQGQPIGRDLEHWLEAERQLRAPARGVGNGALASEVEKRLGEVIDRPPARSATALDL